MSANSPIITSTQHDRGPSLPLYYAIYPELGSSEFFDRFKPAFQKSGQYNPPGIPPFPRRKGFLENGPFQVHDETVRTDT